MVGYHIHRTERYGGDTLATRKLPVFCNKQLYNLVRAIFPTARPGFSRSQTFDLDKPGLAVGKMLRAYIRDGYGNASVTSSLGPVTVRSVRQHLHALIPCQLRVEYAIVLACVSLGVAVILNSKL